MKPFGWITTMLLFYQLILAELKLAGKIDIGWTEVLIPVEVWLGLVGCLFVLAVICSVLINGER